MIVYGCGSSFHRRTKMADTPDVPDGEPRIGFVGEMPIPLPNPKGGPIRFEPLRPHSAWTRFFIVAVVSVLFGTIILTIFLLMSPENTPATTKHRPIIHTNTVVWCVSENETSGVFALSVTIEPNESYVRLSPAEIGEHLTRALSGWARAHRECILGDPAIIPQQVSGGTSCCSLGSYVFVRCSKPFPDDLGNALNP